MSSANYMPLSDAPWLLVVGAAGLIVLAGLFAWLAASNWDDTPETDPDASDIAEIERILRKQTESGRG